MALSLSSLSNSSMDFSAVNTPVTCDWCHTQLQVRNHVYKWTISSFSLRKEKFGQSIMSSVFPKDVHATAKWCLELYPKGTNVEAENSVSLFLLLQSCDSQDVKAKFNISLLTVNGEKFNTHEINLNCFKTGQRFGFEKFIELNILNCEKNGLLPIDSLTIHCEFSVIFGSENICDQSIVTVPACTLIEDMANLLMNEKSTDVTLSVEEGDEVRAHKAILMARSEVFAAMFDHDMEESKLNRVVIDDFEPEVLKEMLHFIYTGEAPNLNQMPGELLAAADKYNLKMLKEMCEKSLSLDMTTKTAAGTLILADRYNAQQLKTQTINFINVHSSIVLETLGWKNLIKSHSELIADVYAAMIPQQPLKDEKVFN